ncbi:MAG: flagellar motor protein MotD [Gammaproteobacteria bacterium]|nr:flagellar motor protein MotD [Gammaproteobacteria bacterium]
MARRRKPEEYVNHERWLVSYADFITLLFAFFVVMYSISSVNEGKYRVLSSSIVAAFSQPAKTVDPIQQGTPLRAPIIQHQAMPKQKDDDVSRIGVDYQVMPSPKEIAEMHKIADEVESSLKDMIDKDIVNVNKTNKGVEIEIKSSILFKSGKAYLNIGATPVLKKIAKIVKKLPNEINVEGFTDNVPIKTAAFPSNWELSAARAASVVHLFTQAGVAPKRLAAIGYGEFKPVAPNATSIGREKNRRVAILILNRPNERRKQLFDQKKSSSKLENSINNSILNDVTKFDRNDKSPNIKPKKPKKSDIRAPILLGSGSSNSQPKTNSALIKRHEFIKLPIKSFPATSHDASTTPQLLPLPEPIMQNQRQGNSR